jgi:alkylhydroperoxidase family enzyme
LADDDIALAGQPLADGQWSAAERALLSAADELHHDRDLSDATWTALAEHYDAPALVEILFVVGQYTMLSMFANAAGIPAS